MMAKEKVLNLASDEKGEGNEGRRWEYCRGRR